MTSGMLGELTRGKRVLPIYTRAWIHSTGEPYASWWGLGMEGFFFFFFFFFVALVHAKENCNPCSCKLCSYSLLSWKLSSCKLYLLVHSILANYIHLVNCILANYIHLVYYVLANYIHASLFFFTVRSFDMVLSFKG